MSSNGTRDEAVYRYADLEDRTVFEVVRRTGKKFVQRRPDTTGGYLWDLEGVERVPYRWMQVEMAAADGGVVWVVEGEKDADRLAALGLVATTSAGGAGWEWPDSWAEHFRGCSQVVVLADNDEPGRKAALQRAAVVGQGVRDVRLVMALPGVGEKGDVSDWLDAGGSVDGLWRLADGAPQLHEVLVPELGELPVEKPRSLAVRWAADAVRNPPPEPPVLVEGFLRIGELAVIGAPRAIGKSWLVYNLAALLGQGYGWFLGALPVQRSARVLIAQGELDEWGTSSRWRMLTGEVGPPEGVAETFDRWRLRIVERRTTGSDDGMSWSDRWFDAVLDGRLEATIVEHGFDVLIIDPWAVYFAGNENSNDEVEAALDKLRDLAMRHGVTVVIVHHLGKGTDGREPEDLWRGASRLADWASTRVTLLPHYSEKQARDMGMSRRQARRYLDVFFLRRSAPTDDFSIALNSETGWWERWRSPKEAGREAGEAQRLMMDGRDVASFCADSGGDWPSLRKAAEALKVSASTARKLLARACFEGAIEEYEAGRGAKGFRLPVPQLLDDEELFADNPGVVPGGDGGV